MADYDQHVRDMRWKLERDARSARNKKYPVAAIMRANDWKAQNYDAIKSNNEWVEKNGLPLEKYRLF